MFNNNVFGPVTSAPAIIYNDTNMSSDNISCTNLSGSIATFDQLSVITFNPISFSADYADITNLSCDNLSVRLRSTMGSISTGNLSADEITLTGDLNASDVYAENILSTGDQLLLMDATVPDRKTMIRRDNASTWISLGNVFVAGGNLSFDYGDLLITTGPGTSSTPEFQIRKSTNGTFAYNSSVLNLSARVALLTQTEVENILNMNDGSTLTLENTASLIGQANSTISSTGEVSFNNLSLSGALTCVSNISTPKLYVNDTFFYGSTGTIVASLVTMSSQVLYNLGDLDYKIISVTGTEYLTCDSTLGNINISNLSVDNLSTNLLNNISAGQHITLSTEAGTNKLVIAASGELNSSNLSLDNLSITNQLTCGGNISTPKLYVEDVFFMDPTGAIVSSLVTTTNDVLYQLGNQNYKIRSLTGATEYMTCDSTLGNTNISNLSVDNLSVTASLTASNIKVSNLIESENISVKRADVVGIDFTNSGDLKSFLDVNAASLKWMLKKSLIFHKDTDTGLAFCKIDHARSNINISNLSVANISTNLLNNISAGQHITLSTEAGTNKLVIAASGELNSSNLSLDNLSVTNQLTCGGNISTPTLYVNDTFFYGSTGAIVSSLVTTTNDVLYQLGNQNYKIRSLTGATEYMTCDSTLGNTNISNLSVDNLSTNLLNNISAGENITLSTESLTNKLVISAVGGLNSSNLSLDNLSVDNVSANEVSLYTLRLKDNTQTTKASWFVYPTAMEIYTQNDFRIRNQGFAGSPNFMFMDTSRNNVNISNLSVSNFDVEFVDLTNNLSDGKGINITSSGGKAVISLQDPVNISTITTENMNVSGSAANFFDGANIYGTATVTNLVSDLTNTLSAGTNITITSVGGKAEISSTGGGGSVPANLSIDNLSVNFDATIGGDLQMLSADIIATSSELFIQDVTCTRNMSVSNALGANSIAASSSLTVGTNATITGNITSAFGDIIAVTGQVFAPNVSGTTVTAGDLNVFSDATITGNMRYTPDAARARRALADGNQAAPGAVSVKVVEFPTVNLTTPTITKLGLSQFRCNSAGNYRVICSLNLINTVSGTLNRRSVRYRILINGAFAEADYGMFSSSCYFRGQGQMTEGNCVGSTVMSLLALDTISIQYETQGGGNLEDIVVRANSYIYIEYMG